MAHYYLVPLVKDARGRRVPAVAAGAWSLKDFGALNYGVLITSQPITNKDVVDLTNAQVVTSALKSAGIETRWAEKAANSVELLSRVLGLAFALQANDDKPDVWLGRHILCGNVGTIAPYSWAMYANEQARIRNAGTIGVRALPASDSFTGTNGTALATYSASWTKNSANDFVINTNAVAPTDGTNDNFAHWNADSFGNDQYAQIKIVAVGGNPNSITPAVRVAASGVTGYSIYHTIGTVELWKAVSGTWTQLGSSASRTLNVNDVLRLEANGTTITPKVNNATTGMPTAQTDNAIASGYAGLDGLGTSTSHRGDDWEGGNLSGGTPAALVTRKSLLGVGV